MSLRYAHSPNRLHRRFWSGVCRSMAENYNRGRPLSYGARQETPLPVPGVPEPPREQWIRYLLRVLPDPGFSVYELIGEQELQLLFPSDYRAA